MTPAEAIAAVLRSAQQWDPYAFSEQGVVFTKRGKFQVHTDGEDVTRIVVEKISLDPYTQVIPRENGSFDFSVLTPKTPSATLIGLLQQKGRTVHRTEDRLIVNDVHIPFSEAVTDKFEKLTLEDRPYYRPLNHSGRDFDWEKILKNVYTIVHHTKTEQAAQEERSKNERLYEEAVYRIELDYGIEGHPYQPYAKHNLTYTEDGIHIFLPNLDERRAREAITLLKEAGLL